MNVDQDCKKVKPSKDASFMNDSVIYKYEAVRNSAENGEHQSKMNGSHDVANIDTQVSVF